MIKINTNHIGDLPLPVNGTEESAILELPEDSGLTVNGKIHGKSCRRHVKRAAATRQLFSLYT